MKSYRDFLKSRRIKPLKIQRTEKLPGSIELVWDPRVGDYVAHVHEGPPKLKLVTSKRRAAA